MLAKALSATPQGVGALFVTVEVDRVQSQLPSVVVVGLPDASVREAKERVLAAIRNLGRRPKPANIVVNLAPADEKKEGSALDLAIAVTVLAAADEIEQSQLEDRLLLGELSLEGRLQPIRGVLPIVLAARERGLRQVIVPVGNAEEASVVAGIEVIAAGSLGEVVRHLRWEREMAPQPVAVTHPRSPSSPMPDMAEVKGQEQARRAVEVAAAGGHHLLLIGPPGSGKSMLAQRLPGILPPLTNEEALATTCVYSVSTRVPRPAGLLHQRPFRAPHHTISSAALIGGGSTPQPGEVSLSHHGVLFLDELTEFRRDVLEGLRQPLEDRTVTVARARSSLTFPASFQLIAAANPCPCGHLGDDRSHCTCSGAAVHRYRSRLSGPLVDRFDLQVVVPAVAWREMTSTRRGEESLVIAQRVADARAVQRSRLADTDARCNGEMSSQLIDRFACPDEHGRGLLEHATQALGLSARGYHRILRVARTIADLDRREQVEAQHLAEAIAYRALDRERSQIDSHLGTSTHAG